MPMRSTESRVNCKAADSISTVRQYACVAEGECGRGAYWILQRGRFVEVYRDTVRAVSFDRRQLGRLRDWLAPRWLGQPRSRCWEDCGLGAQPFAIRDPARR